MIIYPVSPMRIGIFVISGLFHHVRGMTSKESLESHSGICIIRERRIIRKMKAHAIRGMQKPAKKEKGETAWTADRKCSR